jgi:hypothetical protein
MKEKEDDNKKEVSGKGRGKGRRKELHCKKQVRDFPVPSRNVTNQTLPGREHLNYSWESLVSDIPAAWGLEKPLTFFTV